MTTTEPATSWELVAAAKTGDRDAFGQLWTRYRVGVAQYIASRVHNRQTAEDLTVEVFIRAWKAIDTVTDRGRDVGAWFNRIARNITIDHHRSSHARYSTPIAEFEADEFDLLPPTAGPELTVPQQRCEADAAERLDRLVSRLPLPQRVVIRHRFYAELSVAETARRMGLTVGAAKQIQHRACRSLERAAHPARSVVEFTDGTAA